jgi:hypothetical protein
MNRIALAAFAIITILVTMTSLLDKKMAFADRYEKSQTISQTNECSNYWFPINVLCSNLNLQIQGDENSAKVTATAAQEESSKNFGTPFP